MVKPGKVDCISHFLNFDVERGGNFSLLLKEVPKITATAGYVSLQGLSKAKAYSYTLPPQNKMVPLITENDV